MLFHAPEYTQVRTLWDTDSNSWYAETKKGTTRKKRC